MIRPDWGIIDRIRAYTRPVPPPSLEGQWELRKQMLAFARELEGVAAELQDIADDIRRVAP